MIKNNNSGFTLIEISVTIAIMGIIILVIYSLLITGWNFWQNNNDKINLSQQKLLIAKNLEKNIKIAKNIMIKDMNNDGTPELMLNKGDKGNTEKDNYILYEVKDFALHKRIPVNEFSLDGDWPYNDNWETINIITENIISNSMFDSDDTLIYYKFELSKEGQNTVVAGSIHPRLF